MHHWCRKKYAALIIVTVTFVALVVCSCSTLLVYGAGEKLVYYHGASQTMSAGTISSQIIVQRQTSSGTKIYGPSFLPIYLHTTSSTGVFYSDALGQNVITEYAIYQGSTNAIFYYRDTTAGNPTLTITAPNYVPAVATFTINPSVASSLDISAFPSSATAGAANDITVTAKDIYGNIATGYVGTINFASSDMYPAVLPANYQFQLADLGTHTFTGGVIFKTAGVQSITVTDTMTASITGSKTGIAVNPGALDHFLFNSIAEPQIATVPFDVTITAQDTYGNTVSSYFESNDLAASAGTISPTITDAFTNGVWTGLVAVDTVQSNIAILTSGGGCSGASNSFIVISVLHAPEYTFGTLMALAACTGALLVFYTFNKKGFWLCRFRK